MILSQAIIKNIKSYYPEEIISFEMDTNIFVGTNSGGKTNLFEIIQGVINTVLFKHVTVQNNQNFRQMNHPDSNKLFSIAFDQHDQFNLINNILDKHFEHTNEPSSVILTVSLSRRDISTINKIILKKEKIAEFLYASVANSQELIELLNGIPAEISFSEFIEKDFNLVLHANESFNLSINDSSNFNAEQLLKSQKLFEIFKHINIFHELSILIPDLDINPVTRYFGPQRVITQPSPSNIIDLSALSNYEDNFAKSINQNRDIGTSFVDTSFIKLAYLFKNHKSKLLDSYKKYLLKYLKVNFTVSKINHPNKYMYKLDFYRVSGIPMKLSSGEKELFNLISGLILTGVKNGIVLLDEPELHLHFQWQQVIIELIDELSKEFKIQFFIVTHSPKFINTTTLAKVYRVYMQDNISNIIKPDASIESTDLKDLIQYINTTNNEKIFFTQKVLLVEGLSDLIMYSKILEIIKKEISSDAEVEIVEAGSKYNLYRFRELLDQWKITNFIIADLDYIREIRKDRARLINNEAIRLKIETGSSEISQLLTFSENKLKKILCKTNGRDALSVVDLIKNKNNMTSRKFNKEMNDIAEYIITERATQLNTPITISDELLNIFKEISKEEKILILEEGVLENIFPNLNSSRVNKVKNAIDVSKKIKYDDIPNYLCQYFISILNST